MHLHPHFDGSPQLWFVMVIVARLSPLTPGRCLGAMLEVFHAWHADEKLYNAEAIGTSVDGVTRTGLDFTKKNSDGHIGLATLPWKAFRNFYAKIHACISEVSRACGMRVSTHVQALIACLGEDDFMHVQNAITVGLQIVKYFPVMKPHGEAVMAAVQAVNDGKKGPGTPDVQFQAQGWVIAARRN